MENYLKSELIKGSDRTYKGLNKNSGQTVAIKILPVSKDLLADAGFLKSLNSIFLVKVLDVYTSDTKITIIQEYVENGSLRPLAGILNQGLVSKIISQVFLGLSFLAENSIVHGGISLDNVLFTKDSQVKLQLIGRKREKTPGSDQSTISTTKDDIFLLGKFVYELITGDDVIVNENDVEFDKDFRITSDIQKFLEKCFKIEPTSRPSLTELKQSDKWIRIILGLDLLITQQQMSPVVVLEQQDSSEDWSVQQQPLHFPRLQSQIEANFDDDSDFEMQQTQTDRQTPEINQSPTFPSIFQISQDKQKSIPKIEVKDDSDNFDFDELNQPLAIKTVVDNTFLHSTKAKNNEIDDFDDEDDDFNIEPQAPLKLQLKIDEDIIFDDDDSDFQITNTPLYITSQVQPRTPKLNTGLNIQDQEQIKSVSLQLGRLHIRSSQSNINLFDDDDDENINFVIPVIKQKKSTIKLVQHNTQSIQFDDINDELDERKLDDFDSNFGQIESHSLRLVNNGNLVNISFSDDVQEEYNDFNEINLAQQFNDIIKQVTIEKLKNLTLILHQRISLSSYQKFKDDNIEKSLIQTNFAQFILQQLSSSNKLEIEIHFYFMRIVTLLIYSSSQFAISAIFQRHIFYQFDNITFDDQSINFQLQEYIKNDIFDKLRVCEKQIIVQCNFLLSICQFLVSEDKRIQKVIQQSFDVFLKQEGIFAISQLILCFGNSQILSNQILQQISYSGCEMFMSLYKPFSDFKTEIVSQLIKNEENKYIVKDLLKLVSGFLQNQIKTITPTQHKLIQSYFDIIIDIFYNMKDHQITNDMTLIDVLNEILSISTLSELCTNEYSQLLNIILLLSKIKDDNLQNTILNTFQCKFILILSNNTDSMKNLQTIILALINFIFGSELRRKVLSTPNFLQVLSKLIKKKDFLWQFAQTLLLELLKSPPQTLDVQLMMSCAESLSQPLWAKQSADLLLRFNTDFIATQLSKADFSSFPEIALPPLSSYCKSAPLFFKSIFNKSMIKRCYYGLNGGIGVRLAVMDMVCLGLIEGLMTDEEIKKFRKGIEKVSSEIENKLVKRKSREVLLILMKQEQ
ncbi:Kinase [Spironucleus salmonicida]|uniref:non-specific serine/threonine protein kinase n=1 Tax=Spironucleus salmonicida TaxID=348837 RepID=V6LGB6_9EUKA|nr:Kinase [Spironucleus salmonicida]|eukprot:EST43600.1 Kinase [Spironucleus salmonicida]